MAGSVNKKIRRRQAEACGTESGECGPQEVNLLDVLLTDDGVNMLLEDACPKPGAATCWVEGATAAACAAITQQVVWQWDFPTARMLILAAHYPRPHAQHASPSVG
eukprot:2182236-Amphidinium_carterae.2